MYSIQNDEIYTIENLVEIMLKIVLWRNEGAQNRTKNTT